MLTTVLKKNVIKASSYLESFFENIFEGPTYSNVIKLLSCLVVKFLNASFEENFQEIEKDGRVAVLSIPV